MSVVQANFYASEYNLQTEYHDAILTILMLILIISTTSLIIWIHANTDHFVDNSNYPKTIMTIQLGLIK